LDPDSSTGSNYAIEVWDDKPHDLRLMSDISLTVIGVVNKNTGVRRSAPLSRFGPRLRRFRLRRRWLPELQAGAVNVRRHKPLPASRRYAISHSVTSHPRG